MATPIDQVLISALWPCASEPRLFLWYDFHMKKLFVVAGVLLLAVGTYTS